ncbi:AEL216Cp [Eremothecium gossypii ATCC 10895]|uniref:AEL216Cp n=1 Tax=Eremothecium gossypii (strain ATCC 10895 / CBS 109.51 / FGSC 9923 / NRRL Y-1056) TaxID=284811 RepID=Q758H8_EREGS|nr:AEL216Cp [Eremothecium gossypii ATCC 10895]AAS52469.1 AEL216Cp [Eremothecium gossypii ATCC 10895]AEY96768.1 FAEL216Cp [Eremothecium gossypii FDAG1]
MQPKTFIHQLHHMLSDRSLETWIRWSAEDDHIFCLKPYDPEFPGTVLKKNFKHGNVSSFVRQLHLYGFHKLQTGPGAASSGPAGDNEPPTHIIKSNKESMVWYFTHPSGYFYKGACQPDLARIQRKSNGVGKDGKRKNGLSPVCVSILDPSTRGAASPAAAAPPLEGAQRYTTPGYGDGMAHGVAPLHSTPAYADVAKRRSASSLDLLIHHPQSLPQQPLPAAAHQQQNPASHTPQPGPNHQPILRPSVFSVPQQLGTTAASPVASQHIASSNPPATPLEYYHYENNLQLLQRCMLTIVDILQVPPSQQNNIAKQNLNHLRSEILSMDSKWTTLRSYQPYYTSPHSSLSSEASGPLHSNPHSSSTAISLSMQGQPVSSTQKSSIFSNPRLSVASSASLSNGGGSVSGSSQYGGYYQQESKAPAPVFPPLQQQSQYAYPPPQHHTNHSQSY